MPAAAGVCRDDDEDANVGVGIHEVVIGLKGDLGEAARHRLHAAPGRDVHAEERPEGRIEQPSKRQSTDEEDAA